MTPQLVGSTSRRTSTCKQADTHSLKDLSRGVLGQALTGQILSLQALIAGRPARGTSENHTSDTTGCNQNQEAVIFSIHR
jgi:hypothetical protein